MKNKLVTLALIISLSLLGMTNQAESTEKFMPFDFGEGEGGNIPMCTTNLEEAILEVSGVGQVAIRTDLIKIGVEVSTFNENTSQQALSENNVKVERIMNRLLNTLNVYLEQISTITFQITPQYAIKKITNENVLIGFKVTQNLEIVVSNLDLAARIIDQVVNYDGNISYVYFEVSEGVIKDLREDLILRAVEDAISNAKKTARSNRQRITGIKAIKVHENTNVLSSLGVVATETNLIGSTKTISITVEITYTIVKREKKVENDNENGNRQK